MTYISLNNVSYIDLASCCSNFGYLFKMSFQVNLPEIASLTIEAASCKGIRTYVK